MKINFHFKRFYFSYEINELSSDPKISNNIYIKKANTKIIDNEIISFLNSLYLAK